MQKKKINNMGARTTKMLTAKKRASLDAYLAQLGGHDVDFDRESFLKSELEKVAGELAATAAAAASPDDWVDRRLKEMLGQNPSHMAMQEVFPNLFLSGRNTYVPLV